MVRFGYHKKISRAHTHSSYQNNSPAAALYFLLPERAAIHLIIFHARFKFTKASASAATSYLKPYRRPYLGITACGAFSLFQDPCNCLQHGSHETRGLVQALKDHPRGPTRPKVPMLHPAAGHRVNNADFSAGHLFTHML